MFANGVVQLQVLEVVCFCANQVNAYAETLSLQEWIPTEVETDALLRSEVQLRS